MCEIYYFLVKIPLLVFQKEDVNEVWAGQRLQISFCNTVFSEYQIECGGKDETEDLVTCQSN